MEGLSEGPRRTQNRAIPPELGPVREETMESFENEPDTDFSLPQNLAWAEAIVVVPDERIVTGGVDVIDDDHEVAGRVVRVDRARGVGDRQGE